MKRILLLFMSLLTAAMLTGCADIVSESDLGALQEALYADSEITVDADTESAAPDTEPPETSSAAAAAEQAAADTTEPPAEQTAEPPTDESPQNTVAEDGTYDGKDEVALYIHTYGHLPDNYITKKEARALGWSGGSVEDYAPGKCIGGDYFGNYEGLLPEKDGRSYTECDIDTLGESGRGAKRIIFSNDGLIYYTDDHYESFTLLYGEE